MTLRHLEIFSAVCAQESFTRAAEKLNMAQPAVSLAIRELEVFYNVRLFERMNRRVYLTEAGRTLRQYADTVLSQFQESVEVLRESGTQGSFTRAAEKLNMAQPAVSLAIRELETFYAVRLFERMNRRVYLTEAGRNLRQYADTVLSQFRESVEVLRESGAGGSCSFGVHVTLGETCLAGILARLAAELPEMQVRACVQNSRETERMILQNELDFAVVDNVTVSPHYLVEPLREEALAAVCAPEYLSGRDTLTLAELAGERLLLRERGSGTRNSVDGVFQAAGIPVRPVLESVSTGALLSCTRAGLGITLLPRSLVEADLSAGRLRELAVADGAFRRTYFLVRHRSKYLTDGMQRALQVVREEIAAR